MKAILLTCALMMAGTAYAQQRPFDPAFKEALDACHTETGTTRPSPGSRPSEEDRAKMQSCMTAKGYTLPDHPPGQGEGGRHHRRPASAADGQSQNSNEQQGAGAIQ